MTKTTVYLPDDLKAALARVAATTGRSEAGLIREAIAALVSQASPPRPRGGLFRGEDSLSTQVDEHLSGFGER